MHPLEALGLPPEADERAVKRAYAQRLKVTRPDEDPEGFQRLHEIYRAALAFLENPTRSPIMGSARPDRPPGDASTPPAPFVPPTARAERLGAFPLPHAELQWAMPVAEPVPDVEALIDDLVAQLARTPKPEAFRLWLEERLSDWPITYRLEAAPTVLHAIRSEDVDVAPAQLEILIDAFNFDDVQSRCDPVDLAKLRRRAEGELLSPHSASVMRRVKRDWLTWLVWGIGISVAVRIIGRMMGP